MKNIKNTLILALLISLIFASCKPEVIHEDKENSLPEPFSVENLIEKSVPLYLRDATTPAISNMQVYIPVDKKTKKELPEIPYINVADYLSFWNYVQFNSSLEAKTETLSPTKVKIYRTPDNSFGIVFDSAAQTIYFQDYDAAMRKTDKDPLINILSSISSSYIKNTGNNFNRYGKFITIKLADYGIELFIQDGKVYLPLSTFGTFFNTYFTYNKSGIFLSNTSASTTFYDKNSGKDDRSDDLKYFNYRDTCLALDFLYGLKETHGIDYFHEYFIETGLIEDFLGTAEDSIKALYKLGVCYFADFHSGLNTPSYYSGTAILNSEGKYEPDDVIKHPVYSKTIDRCDEFESARSQVWNNKGYSIHKSPVTRNIDDYYEIGDTAFITFDSFEFPQTQATGIDYYSLTENGTKDLEYKNVYDTVGLVVYAHQQIKKNPEIKNIVIDDSLNGGGMADALIYILSWVLGETPFSIKNIYSGGMCTASYTADVDLDGDFSKDDSLQGLDRDFNIFCVTSINSFSCGNAFPAFLKESGKVTILGTKSGGGACVVRNLASADGALYQISGPLQLCTVKNGSYYQIDEGVEPDHTITDKKIIYDRDALASFIKNRVLYSK